jgi:hypothetical protein
MGVLKDDFKPINFMVSYPSEAASLSLVWFGVRWGCKYCA